MQDSKMTWKYPLKRAAAAFPYGQFISIVDSNGNSHNCYCIDVATAKLIRSLPKRKSSLKWKFLPKLGFASRGYIGVTQFEDGFIAQRVFRLNGKLVGFTLAHQLNDIPIVLPSLEIGMAAAELYFPKPNRALGYLWWTDTYIPATP